MDQQQTSNFKANALELETLRQRAPSIFADGPMTGLSKRYTFVPTGQIVSGLREQDWVPVSVEEQRSRIEAKRGFQKHMIRFRLASQMQSLAEWNVELVLINSHDAGSAYQLHAGIYRRICSNGLVLSEQSFEALRFRHAGLDAAKVVESSFKLIEFIPQISGMVQKLKARVLAPELAERFAAQALRLRYDTLAESPVEPMTLLQVRRPEDEGLDLWHTFNRVQEGLIQGGLSDHHTDRRGRLKAVRRLRGIDSKVVLNKALWELAAQVADGKPLPPARDTVLAE